MILVYSLLYFICYPFCISYISDSDENRGDFIPYYLLCITLCYINLRVDLRAETALLLKNANDPERRACDFQPVVYSDFMLKEVLCDAVTYNASLMVALSQSSPLLFLDDFTEDGMRLSWSIPTTSTILR